MHRFLLILVTLLGFNAAASASELLMFRQAGCPWCAAWDRQVAPAYPNTAFGRRAPVRFVDMDGKEPTGVALRMPVRFSPTFVLVDAGREVGRIEGYPGEDFFWGLLEKVMAQLPAAGHSQVTTPPLSTDGRTETIR